MQIVRLVTFRVHHTFLDICHTLGKVWLSCKVPLSGYEVACYAVVDYLASLVELNDETQIFKLAQRFKVKFSHATSFHCS